MRLPDKVKQAGHWLRVVAVEPAQLAAAPLVCAGAHEALGEEKGLLVGDVSAREGITL